MKQFQAILALLPNENSDYMSQISIKVPHLFLFYQLPHLVLFVVLLNEKQTADRRRENLLWWSIFLGRLEMPLEMFQV